MPVTAGQRNAAKMGQQPCIFYLNVFMIIALAILPVKSFTMDTDCYGKNVNQS
jgi:hypothetical protein